MILIKYSLTSIITYQLYRRLNTNKLPPKSFKIVFNNYLIHMRLSLIALPSTRYVFEVLIVSTLLPLIVLQFQIHHPTVPIWLLWCLINSRWTQLHFAQWLTLLHLKGEPLANLYFSFYLLLRLKLNLFILVLSLYLKILVRDDLINNRISKDILVSFGALFLI